MRHAIRTARVALLLALPLGLAACGKDAGAHEAHEGHGHDAPAAETAGLVCPPCGMDLPADHETVELAGMKFAFCSDYCVEKVTADPELYAKFAVQ